MQVSMSAAPPTWSQRNHIWSHHTIYSAERAGLIESALAQVRLVIRTAPGKGVLFARALCLSSEHGKEGTSPVLAIGCMSAARQPSLQLLSAETSFVREPQDSCAGSADILCCKLL